MASTGPSPEWLDARVQSAAASPTLAMNELMRARVARGQPVYRLGFGQSPFPVPERVVESLRMHADASDYLPMRGLPALREAVADHTHRHTGLRYDPADVLIGPGTKTLLFLVQLAVDADVLVPSPGWVSYAPQARIGGRRVTWLPTRREERWHLDPDLLDQHCRRQPGRHLLVLNSPGNPNGASMPADRLQALAAVARKHGVLILSDEIYGLVEHQGRHESVAAQYHEGTLVTTGLSKWCGAGGWRLGAMLVPTELAWLGDRLATLAGEAYSCVSAPVQYAAVTAFEGGPDIEAYLVRVRRILRALGREVATRLDRAGFAVDPPDGGFYVFPDAGRRAGIRTSAEFCARCLEETGVALLPGSDFGRPDQELTFRLSYVDFDGRAALEAAGRQAEGELGLEFLEQWCRKVIEGTDRLVAWNTDYTDYTEHSDSAG